MKIKNEQLELVKKSLKAAVSHKGNLYEKKYADIDIDAITADSFCKLKSAHALHHHIEQQQVELR